MIVYLQMIEGEENKRQFAALTVFALVRRSKLRRRKVRR